MPDHKRSIFLKHVPYPILGPLLLGLVLQACGQTSPVQPRRILFHDEPSPSNKQHGRSTAFGFERNAATYGMFARRGWATLPVSLSFEATVSDDVRTAVMNAAQTWNAAVGSEILVFGEDTEPYRGTLEGRFQRPLTTIGVERSWCRTKKDAVIVGTTIWHNSPDDDEKIISGHIVLNGDHYILTDSLSRTRVEEHATGELASGELETGNREIVDAETLALHELGHLLGLSHVNGTQPSVMNPVMFIGAGEARRELEAVDVARIRLIYRPGEPPPPLPPLPPTPPQPTVTLPWVPDPPRPSIPLPPRPPQPPCDMTSE